MATWIAWVKGLPEKPEIFGLAEALGINQSEAAARCMAVWGWADEHTDDGVIMGMKPGHLDRIAGLDGFGQALVKVGWLEADAESIIFPKWDRWNTQSAKARLRHAERQRRYRQRESVTGG